MTLERLHGRQHQRIAYRHLIGSLVRKPGAFANYRYRDALFPSLTFRRAYDRLPTHQPSKADRAYVRVLHLAAMTREGDVEAALVLLEDAGPVPTFEATRARVRPPTLAALPHLQTPTLDLTIYDQVLGTSTEAEVAA